MGFIQRWNVGEIKSQLGKCAAEVCHSGNDGFSAWHCKIDLLEVKYYLDELLEKTPKFSGEEEFHEEKAKQKMWRALNEKTNQS